ncbi:MAG: hypothetical protein HP028_05785 [Clostridia bacterium]|jgi:hypothetical protein|nr:hypothetical protein [Clostridia bacterium]
MKSIYNYFQFSEVEEAHKITKDIEKIRIQVKYEIQNDPCYGDELDYYDNVLPWINEFNFTMLNIEIPYILVCNYYNKGIPEYREVDLNEKEYQEIDYINKYYFNYFSRICLFEIKSNFERTIHIISNLYNLGINHYEKDIISRVIKYLRTNDKKLYKYLIDIQSNPVYNEMENLRNQLTHSFSPLNTRSLPEYHKSGLISYGVRQSKSSTEIKNVIESSLKLLKEYVDFLGKHIEQFYIEKFDRK